MKKPLMKKFTLIVFAALWLSSFVSLIFSYDFYPKALENRTWATLPAKADFLSNPAKFTKQFGDYTADNFGLRSSFIRFHNWTKYTIFQTPPNDMVMLGKDGWLFWAGEKSLPFYRKVQPFSAEDFNRLIAMFNKTQVWLKKHGANFVIMIPPDPPNVYPEKLPDWFVVEKSISRRHQIIESANYFMEYPILDLVPVLQKAKTEHQLYYSTDSHWNTWGGYNSIREVMHQLHEKNPEFPELDPNLYNFTVTKTQGIDLARSIGLPDLFSDTQVAVEPINPSMSYEKTDEIDAHNYTTICKQCPDITLLMIMDSYGEAMQPFLSSNFRKVIYVWDNSIPFKRIEKEKPNLVLFQFVERKLLGLPPYEVPEN